VSLKKLKQQVVPTGKNISPLDFREGFSTLHYGLLEKWKIGARDG
jgi:hypothetical protein